MNKKMLHQKAKYKGNGKYSVRPATIVRKSFVDADLTTKIDNISENSDFKSNRVTKVI